MPNLYVATNGLSIWRSTDLGETLERMPTGTGLYSGTRAWSLLSTSRGLLAGTDSGIYRWDAAPNVWVPLPSPLNCQLITALAASPGNPNVILAGAQPGSLYRSENGGESWRKIEAAIAPYVNVGFRETPEFVAKSDVRPPARHWTRVTQIVFDPLDANAVWAGVEIDGAWRSRDGGRSFERSSEGFATDDIHGFAVINNGSRVIYATTNKGLYQSCNDGTSWQMQPFDSPWVYTRSIMQHPRDPNVLFMTNGNGAPGTMGRLYRSADAGVHWRDVNLPGKVESSVYFVTMHPADANLVFAAATLGQLYRSTDGGKSWVSLPQRLSEIRALLWLPD